MCPVRTSWGARGTERILSNFKKSARAWPKIAERDRADFIAAQLTVDVSRKEAAGEQL